MTLKPLHQSLIDAIQGWNPQKDSLTWSDESFFELAHQIFRHQYTHNSTYRTFCKNRRISPENLSSIDELPAVPTDAFKLLPLFIDEEPAHTFRTSGTTQESRGAHHFATLEVYRQSLHPPFIRFCLPEEQPLRLLILAPPASDLTDSSLSFMLTELYERWDDGQGGYFITLDDKREWRLDANGFARALDKAVTDDAPTMILGTAFAYAEFFARVDGNWQLPKGSRLMETGGFKGRVRDLSRQELYESFTTRLGIPAARCLSEYSMTELSSQTYSDQLWAGNDATGRFYGPPWLKIQIVDPLTLKPGPKAGEAGLIRFIDLANVDSVMAVQTSDRGILYEDGGLELLGRAPDAELRGCSLTIEEIVEPYR